MGHRLRTTVTVVASVATLLALTGAPAAHASKASDVQDARQGALQADDFPSGWSGTRNTGISDAKAIRIASTIPGCSQYVKLRKTTAVLPEARSLEYGDGVATSASNVVTAFASDAKAAAALKLFSGSTIASCLEKFVTKGAGGSVDVTVAQSDISDLGDRAVAYSAKVTGSDGSTAKLLDIAVQVGRYVDVFTFTNSDDNPPNDALETAMHSSIARLADAG